MIKLYSAQVVGLDAKLITIEVDLSPGLHIFSIVGLADKEIQESRERIGSAIRNIGARPPHKKSQRVIINLAPADLKKEGPAFDLPIALGFLLASDQARFNPEKKLFVGELGLDGSIKKVAGILPIVLLAKKLGFETVFIPKGNGREASLVEGIDIKEVEHIDSLLKFLEGKNDLASVSPHAKETIPHEDPEIDFSHIKGQETAKRALEIAAAGGHNLLMEGPPGTGKTLLAKALLSILPDLEREEIIEVTKIYSVAGLLKDTETIVASRPYRAPHHTASAVSITGGGATIKPGEITLAHRGVLFLDEFPEFDRRVLESLRQPLENREITIARAQGSVTYPAEIMLVAAMNPCPCGHYGNPKKECVCSPGTISKYRRKISGPLLDRIDLYIDVPHIEYEKLTDGSQNNESSETIKKRIEKTRAIQRERFSGKILTNSAMQTKEIKAHCVLDNETKSVLETAYNSFAMSPRSYFRTVKVARTIADLDASECITANHVLQALQYRARGEM
ncbi:YifB family Mg chelatase-like AAA ATPase [Patescibacteria group bacterium]|nr:YifB family Mg chelatase-like AAA ATPase [Patescibacteria group bacterium]